MDFPSELYAIALGAPPVLLGITLHEAAHGYVARMFGDRTAELAGRITLNPIRHVDLIGTIVVPVALYLLKAGFLFGWAKPVPVNFANLDNPKRDMFWVAAAGPGSNLVMAIAWAIALRFVDSGGGMEFMARLGVQINLILMVLNLVPILPLDGGRIAVSLLPREIARVYSRTEPYGFIVIIALLATGMLSRLIDPLLDIAERLLGSLVGV